MRISAIRLEHSTSELLQKCGVGCISKRPAGSSYTGEFEIRVPMNISKSFINLTLRLAEQFSLPRPMFETFLDSKIVNESSGYIEASYLYHKEGIVRLMNVLAAAFESGLPDGFLIKELRQHQWR
jgi:hypothetical protein